MPLDSFSDLKDAIKNWPDRADIGDSFLTDFVALADARIRKDLARDQIRVREMEMRDSLTPDSGRCTLPDDFMSMVAVQCRASNPTVLTYKPMTWLNEQYPDGDSGTPAYYGIEGAYLYMFPLTTSDIRIVYYAYPQALSDSNTSNWLLAKYPDVYLWAGLLELANYDGDDELQAKAQQLLTAAFDGLKSSAYGADASHGFTMGASAFPV